MAHESLSSPPAARAPWSVRVPTWLWVAGPLAALLAMLAVFAWGNPLSVFTADVPPVEDLTFERIVVVPEGFRVSVFNGGAAETVIAQVMVDDAYWRFTAWPSASLPRLGRAVISIPYPWVQAEPHVIRVVTETGVTFEGEVAAATLTPKPGLREFGAYGLLGVYVGIIPVGLGMAWFPAMQRLGRRGLGAILALTIGLLVFLLADTLLEALEVAATLPEVYQGMPLALFGALLAWLAIAAVGTRRGGPSSDPAARRLWIAAMIALGIGLHNLGEGLAIGAAFALGEAALGSFLVIGFTLHNITEGVGIVAPLLGARRTPGRAPGGGAADPAAGGSPSPRQFVGLALLAGAPAIVGAWVGGFAYSPLLAVLFLGIGAGAIWQVIVEVGALLRRDAEREGLPVISWLNVGALMAGIGVMYLTAFLVK